MSTSLSRKLRWREVAIVFQSAVSVLNPVLRVRDQIVDVLKAHFEMSWEGMRERAAKTEATGFIDTLLQAGDAVIELFSCGMPMQENFFNPTKREPGLFHVVLAQLMLQRE
jgi:ABC-type glutathione transport system ATPase component